MICFTQHSDLSKASVLAKTSPYVLTNIWQCPLKGATACVHDKSLQSCLTLCHPMDCSPPGSSVHGILQARILEWVAIPPSRGSSGLRDQTHISYISCTGSGFFFWEAPFFKGINPLMGVLTLPVSSKPNFLPKVPPPTLLHWD